MTQKNTGKRNKRPPAMIFLLILAGLFAVYFVSRFLSAISARTESVLVNKVVANESVVGEGWIVRNETVINCTSSSNVKHLITNGERVRANEPLAQAYSTEAAMESAKEIDAITEDISLLTAAMQSAGNYSDTARVDELISNQLQLLSTQMENGVCSQFAEYSANVRQLSMRRNATTLDTDSLRSEIDLLSAKKLAIEKRIQGKTTTVSAPNSGYFIEITDGYESILNADNILSATASSFEKLVEKEQKATSYAFGKIIEGFDWYFAMVVPSEDAVAFKAGNTVTLRFAQLSDDYHAEVVCVNTGKGEEQSLVVFRGTDISTDVLSGRKMTVEVILKQYSGLKIPTDAVYMLESEDGTSQLGVYILTGTTSRFKKITPIYQGDSYYVIKQESNSDSVVAGDSVIVKGLNLSDGKALKK